VVALVEAAQAFGHLGAADQPVEALGLDPQPFLERPPEPAYGRLLVGMDRRLGQCRDHAGELERPLTPPAQNASSPAPVRTPTSASSSSQNAPTRRPARERSSGRSRSCAGPVDRDDGDRAVLLVKEMFVAHDGG
jgi:hypothetical protein